jgi:NAD-dependent SIR2 family protein deacetylase
MIGWPLLSQAQPNAAHAVLAELQRNDFIGDIVTQNVDSQHQRSGAERVLDLHGRIAGVICMRCNERSLRSDMQDRLLNKNPEFASTLLQQQQQQQQQSNNDGDKHDVQSSMSKVIAPDGDVHIEQDTEAFRVPSCRSCAGVLKPDVVFFGDNVSRPVLDRAMQSLERSSAVLCIGSSLMVFSGRRFVMKAAANGGDKPVAILNQGFTRGDSLATLKVSENCVEVLQCLRALLMLP